MKELIYDGFEGMNVIEEMKVFFRFVIIIIGWGKLSKEEGRL